MPVPQETRDRVFDFALAWRKAELRLAIIIYRQTTGEVPHDPVTRQAAQETLDDCERALRIVLDEAREEEEKDDG